MSLKERSYLALGQKLTSVLVEKVGGINFCQTSRTFFEISLNIAVNRIRYQSNLHVSEW